MSSSRARSVSVSVFPLRRKTETETEIATPTHLLRYLRSRGLAVRRECNDLLVGPASLLTDALRRLVREHKAGLLALVDAEEQRLAERLPGLLWPTGPDRPWLWAPPDEPDPEYDALVEWFLHARLLFKPFQLNSGLVIADPEACYGHYRRQIQAGARGQVRRQIRAFLGSLKEYLHQ